MVYIGIDVGATTIKIGIVDQHGSILVKDSCLTLVHRGYQQMVDDMVNLSKKLLSASGHTMADVHSVGIGIPGMQDMRTHRVPFCTNLQWHDVPLEEIMRERMGVPVYVNNDANVAALAEAKAGATKNVKNSVVVTLGTGVGSGIVVDGKVVYGSDGFAGELGHFVVDHSENARSCGCGRKGCLEAYTSATGVARTAREYLEKSSEPSLLRDLNPDEITSYDVFKAAEANDKLALDIFEFTGRLLGTACADFATFCSPEAFVFFGGLTKAGEYLMKPLRQAYNEHVLFLYKDEAKLLISSLNGSEAAVLGASALGWE